MIFPAAIPMATGSVHRSQTPGLDALIHKMVLLLVFVLMTISPMALNAIGWNYDGLGGSGPTRFHPASYIAFLLLFMIALRDGNPLASLLHTLGRDHRLSLFAIAWLLIFLHGTLNQALPAAALIDTFLLPLVILMIFTRLDDPTRATMARIVHFCFALNALLGLAEFLSGLRLTPYVAGGILITDDWRSTALLGHPLGNALMTGCYIAILLLGGARELRGGWRAAMISLQFAAMVAFGGRASLILLLLFATLALIRAIGLFLIGRRFRLRHLVLIAILAPLVLGAIGLLLELGTFDKLILRFVEDKGSANARIVMFELFRGFTWPELLLGPPQDQLSYLVHVNKLEFGIESLWVAFSLFYGIVPSILFFTGLVFFLFALASALQKRAWLVLAYFFAVNTTFLGLAGKTVMFANLCLILLLLLPSRPLRERLHAPQKTVLPSAFSRGPLPC